MTQPASSAIVNELLYDFKEMAIKDILRKEIVKLDPDWYDDETYKMIINGIPILGEALFLNKHGVFKGMPRLKMTFFFQYFEPEMFSRGLEGMVKSGVFYNVEHHTSHLDHEMDGFMEKAILTEYAKLYLRWMISCALEDKDKSR